MHLVNFFIRIYHNARSPERQKLEVVSKKAGAVCLEMLIRPLLDTGRKTKETLSMASFNGKY